MRVGVCCVSLGAEQGSKDLRGTRLLYYYILLYRQRLTVNHYSGI